MKLEPQPLQEEFRVEQLKHRLKDLDRADLEEYTKQLLSLCSKLTHQTKQLLNRVVELES